MKKRLLSVLLACGMALTLLPAAAFAEDSKEAAETPVCVCETACGTDNFNADCPVCGAEGAQVPDCGKYVAAAETPAALAETKPEEPQAEPTQPIVTAPGEIPTEVATEEDLKAALEKGGNITLTNDMTLTEALCIYKDVTLDLNGHTLTRLIDAPAIIVYSGSSLTLTDSSKAGTGKVTSSCKAVNVCGGSLILESGTVSCTSSYWYAICVNVNSTVTLKGGTVSATSGGRAIDLIQEGASGNNPILYADGGTVEGPVINKKGTITRSSDNVTTATTFTGNVQNGGLIEWGTFNGSVENSYSDGGSKFGGTISGGTFYGTVTNSVGTISDTAKLTVTFDSNGGSEVAEQKILKGQTVEQPANPTKERATFLGWYTDADCTEAYDFGKPVTENLTIYAAWEELITVEVPYTTTVTLGDNTAPGKVTFELEAFDPWGSPLEDVTISGSVETNGVGSYLNDLTITGLQSEVERIEFFFVRQKQGTEANWTYDDTVYCVQRVWEQDEPSILSTKDVASIEFEIYATEYVDKMYIPLEDNTIDMAFENVYTLHTHNYSQQYDADSHWMECPCGDIQELELHQFGEWVVTREPTMDELGEQERVCSVCGYSETEDLPVLVGDDDPSDDKNKNGSNQTGSTNAPKTGSPKTGDEMSLSTMVAALALSSAAIIGLAVTGKKRGRHQ